MTEQDERAERRFGNWLLVWGVLSVLWCIRAYAGDQVITDPCYTCAQMYPPDSWSYWFYCVLGLGCW